MPRRHRRRRAQVAAELVLLFVGLQRHPPLTVGAVEVDHAAVGAAVEWPGHRTQGSDWPGRILKRAPTR